MGRVVVFAALAALIGCDDGGGGEGTPDDAQPLADAAVADVGPDALPPDTGPPLRACETTRGALPEGLETLAWDDDTPVADLSTQTWSILDQPLAESVLHESVRFDLDRPARVHGFSIRYGHLPDDGEAPIAAGLYPDFGYNGFDFWAPDPLWTGTRCRDDADADGWLTFRLPQPVEVAQPGLVYVAHRREGAGSPAWAFDGTPPTPECEAAGDCCAPFTACHSAWNLPELTEYVAGGALNFAFNGLTTTFQYDYLVRLHVEYLEPVPEAPVFRPIEGPTPSNRMAFGDYDGDGDDDLFVNGPRLLRNDGGAFTDVTEATGLAALDVHGSGVWGDYDNDGCLDVFVFDETDTRPDHLLRGDCAGGFTDVTEAAGIADVQSVVRCEGRDTPHAPTAAAAWLDIDADGFLDLYQGNFICWNEGTFYPDTVWHNEGDGTFTEWTGTHGFRSANQTQLATRGANPIDYDQDGDVDLLVNHYRLQVNLFYRNLGDGTVEPAQLQLNLGGNRARKGGTTYYGHTIGTAWGDLDGDARFDVVVANLAHPRFFDFSDKTQVLLQNPDGTFRDLQGDFSIPMGDAGLRYQETHSVPTLADFDQDGALDLVISAVYDGRPTDFYWGNGDGTFRLDVHSTRIPVTNGWGMATADVDLDGDPDLAAQGAILENTGGAGHWLQVRAVGGARSNRAGIGASVRVEAGGRTFLRHVNGGTGQGCQDSLVAHVGLGDLDSVDRVTVLFVGAGEVVFEGPFDADQRLWLFEDGSTHAGFAPAVKAVFTYLRDVWTAFDEDNASLLAAGIAFYTVLSLAPMLLLVLKAVAIIYGAEAAQGTLEAQLNDFVGDEAAGLLNDAVKALDEDPGGGLAAWLSVGFLVWSGTRLFTQLQAALNQVWGVHARPEGFKQSALALLRKRAMSLGLVGALALLTLASVLVNSVVAATAAWFTNILPVPAFVLRLLDMAVSTAILGSGLLVVYRFLPDVHVKTRHVWPGALMAAGAFSLARFGIAWYLTHQSVGSAYGAAGSLVVLLFWMYVSAMILLFGAEATTITAQRMGDAPRPEAFAEKVC